MSLKSKFTDHPAAVGETYTEHFAAAMSYSLPLFRAAFCAAVHAILPFCFEKTSSEVINHLHRRLTDSGRANGGLESES